jgi:hypothetical protein
MSASDVQPRPPRHRLLRRGTLRGSDASVPVRLRNISAEGAMIESGSDMEPGCEVELDLAEGLCLTGKVRWSQDGRVGLKFDESFDLQRLGRAPSKPSRGVLRPDYLRSELDPESPWAARQDRLTVRDVKRK